MAVYNYLFEWPSLVLKGKSGLLWRSTVSLLVISKENQNVLLNDKFALVSEKYSGVTT